MKPLVLLCVLSLPVGAHAQESPPTPESALRAIREMTTESDNYWEVRDAGQAVLRQAYATYTEEELDAFAGELEKMIRAEVEPQADMAAAVLRSSNFVHADGTPYARAAEVLIRVYESYRDDPALAEKAGRVLRHAYYAGGEDYVVELLRTSERPPRPCFQGGQLVRRGEVIPPEEEWCFRVRDESEWCRAADVILWEYRRLPVEGPATSMFLRYCGEWRLLPSYLSPSKRDIECRENPGTCDY